MNWRWFPILVLLLTPVYGQDPYSIKIDKSKGLPSNAVYDIFQDSKGFMWFATDEGLCRYDGKIFKTYTSSLLTSRAGTCIKEDKLGRIWYTNFDGRIYYVEHDSLHNIKQDQPLGTFIKFAILNNYIFKVNTSKLEIYELNRLTLVKTIDLGIPLSLASSSDYVFIQTEKNRIYRFDKDLQQSIIEITDNIAKSQIYGALGKEAYMVSKSNPNQEYYAISKEAPNRVISFPYNEYIANLCFTDNNIWICTKNGIYRSLLVKEPKTYTHYYSNKFISFILKDRDQNYWISTTNEGVLFVPSFQNNYYSIPETSPGKLKVVGNKLLIGGKNNTITEFDLVTKKSKLLFKIDNNHEVSSFLYDSTNHALLVSSDNLYYQKDNKIIYTISLAVKEMDVLDNKYYALASSGMVGLWEPGGMSVINTWDSIANAHPNNVKGYEHVFNIISNVRARSLVLNPTHSVIYATTNKGLFSISSSEIKEIKKKNETILARKVLYFKNYLLVLENNGLILQVLPEKEVNEFPLMINGHIEPVNQIILHHQYLFLISNQEGVYVIDLNKGKLQLKKIEGLTNNEDISDIEIWKDQYIVACANGLLFINSTQLEKKENHHELIINSFSIGGTLFDPNSKSVVPYYKNEVNIDYSILSFQSTFNYPLYYRINMGEWRLLPPESRNLELASLKPDYYQIDFRLDNEERIKSIVFIINKPIWQVHWFWAGILLIVLIIVFILYKWRVRLLSRKNQLLLEKVELEKNLNKSILTSVKAQMNPHFFYNALNTIQSFIYADDKKNATTYLSKFSKLTRLILEMSEKEVISLTEELQALRLYLDIEKVRFNNKLDFEIMVSSEIDQEMIKIPSMIIQPYVENAIKHGLLHKKEDCHLLIDFKIESEILVITIEDNGIGRVKSGQLNTIKDNIHQSFATSANQKRLEILNLDRKDMAVRYVDKYDKIGNSQGTTVIISLPLNPSHGK